MRGFLVDKFEKDKFLCEIYKSGTVPEINAIHWEIQESLALIQKEIDLLLTNNVQDLVSNSGMLAASHRQFSTLKPQIILLQTFSKQYIYIYIYSLNQHILNPIYKIQETVLKIENIQQAKSITRKAKLFYQNIGKLKTLIDRNFTVLDPIQASLILKNIDSILQSTDFSGISEIEKNIKLTNLVKNKIKKVNEQKFQEAFSARVMRKYYILYI